MPISVMQSMPRALLAARVFAEKATSQKPQYMEPLDRQAHGGEPALAAHLLPV